MNRRDWIGFGDPSVCNGNADKTGRNNEQSRNNLESDLHYDLSAIPAGIYISRRFILRSGPLWGRPTINTNVKKDEIVRARGNSW
jgi:hypothetical protein